MILNEDMVLTEAVAAMAQGNQAAFEAIQQTHDYLIQTPNIANAFEDEIHQINNPTISMAMTMVKGSLGQVNVTGTPEQMLVSLLDALDKQAIYGEDIGTLFSDVFSSNSQRFLLLSIMSDELGFDLKDYIKNKRSLDFEELLMKSINKASSQILGDRFRPMAATSSPTKPTPAAEPTTIIAGDPNAQSPWGKPIEERSAEKPQTKPLRPSGWTNKI